MFGLVAILPIALIDRLRFLFLSPLFLVRTFTKANFYLAPPPPPPTVPKLLRPYRIVTVKDIFLPRHQHEIKRKQSTDIVQLERGRVE